MVLRPVSRISFTARAHHLTFGRDQHQFVDVGHGERPDDVAGFISGLHRDDAFAAAGLFAVIIERRAFADPVLARDEQHRCRIHNRDGNDVVAFLRTNSPDADGVASLVAQLFFVKTQTHAFLGDENELVVAGW